MNLLSLLALSMGKAVNPMLLNNKAFRGPTPSKHKGTNKEGLPSGYPGAKLARKAAQRAVGVKHPRGLRLDGITC